MYDFQPFFRTHPSNRARSASTGNSGEKTVHCSNEKQATANRKSNEETVSKKGGDTTAKVESLFKTFMKEERLRCTRERLSVLREIYRSNTHLDADELFVRLREKGVAISRATVYHTLDLLFRYNLVTKIDLGHKHTHYEKSWGVANHLHIICLKCGKVSEATSSELGGMMEKLCREHGYSLGSFSLQLFGECIDKEACDRQVKEKCKENA